MSTFEPCRQIRQILLFTILNCIISVLLFSKPFDSGAMSLKFQLWRGRKWRPGRNREAGAIDFISRDKCNQMKPILTN